MPTQTKIEWADYISNPLKARYQTELYPAIGNHPITRTGHVCVKLSEGCAHCWASVMNVRLGTGLAYTIANQQNTETFLDEKELARLEKFNPHGPFKNGRKRAMIFPCDMTDLFGDWVPLEYINRIFDVFEKRQDVDFLVLTKRVGAMFRLASSRKALPNVIMGASIENQARAVERWPRMEIVAKRGWKTAVSYEPALQFIEWDPWDFLSVLITGGESGNQARPMPLRGALAARDFCQRNKIPFFFKQWGEWAPVDDLVGSGCATFKHQPQDVDGVMMLKVGRGMAGHLLDGIEWRQMPGGNNG